MHMRFAKGFVSADCVTSPAGVGRELSPQMPSVKQSFFRMFENSFREITGLAALVSIAQAV